MQLGFVHLNKYCTGCKGCQVACKDWHDSPVGENLRRITTIEGGGFTEDGGGYSNDVFTYHLSISCNHCSNPICVQNCPAGAITKRTEDGIVVIDQKLCIGCGTCKRSCPYDAPQMQEETGRMAKCDMCKDRLAEGKNPVCVDSCQMRALACGDIQELKKEYNGVSAVDPLPDASETQPNLIIVPHKDSM